VSRSAHDVLWSAPEAHGHTWTADLLRCVPAAATRILHLGCGDGALGKALKRRQGARVVGVEPDDTAAAQARAGLDAVIEAEPEDAELDCVDASLDCIVLGDYLGRARDPERLLRRMGPLLAPGGRVVASFANARHCEVIGSLFRGDWSYQSYGWLDPAQRRLFTRREIEKLFFRAGYGAGHMELIPGAGYGLARAGATWRDRDRRDAD
jgi:O-antigen biosynthesis protein